MKYYENKLPRESGDYTELSPQIYKHYQQRDLYNCGVIILDCFERIVHGTDLNTPSDLEQYKIN